jgi:hypothetical protein
MVEGQSAKGLGDVTKAILILVLAGLEMKPW